MSDESIDLKVPGSTDGYISLLMRIWVGDDWEVVRGSIEEVHTGKRLPLDLSALVSFLKDCMATTTGAQPEETSSSAIDRGSSPQR